MENYRFEVLFLSEKFILMGYLKINDTSIISTNAMATMEEMTPLWFLLENVVILSAVHLDYLHTIQGFEKPVANLAITSSILNGPHRMGEGKFTFLHCSNTTSFKLCNFISNHTGSSLPQ